LSRLESLLLNLSIGLSAISGVVYLVMRDFLKRTDPFSVLGHPWQPHALAAHVLVGPVVVFALGLIARDHVLERLKNRKSSQGRLSGLMTLGLAAPMIASGYLLQIATGQESRRLLGWAHLVTGLLFALLFGAHVAVSSMRRRDAVPDRRTAPGAAS
jgi:undecaprenyl pyrophosphate phosphatase UppP